MIKPIKILLFYILITGIFIGFGMLFPKEGLSFKIGKFHHNIKGFSVKEAFLSEIPNSTIDSSSLKVDGEEMDSVMNLALSKSQSSILPSEDNVRKDKNKPGKLHLIYNPDFKKSLYHFYQLLKDCRSGKKLVRILHMGDSQLEGDRITKYLRENWQENFRGSGPGLITVYDPKKQFSSIWIDADGDWSEHLVYKYPRDIFNNEYGLLGRVAKIDSGENASISFVRSFMALDRAKKYYKARLFLNNVTKPVYIRASYEGGDLPVDTVDMELGLSEINWTFKTAPRKFKLQFQSEGSPSFMGICLDSLAGVAVDNISMRGQYTPRLDKNNIDFFSSMAGYMDIGMIILQYGTNIVPTVSKNYSFYSKMLFSQLELLKEMMPDVPVVVVGVGDVGTVKDGISQSYEHVKLIRDAQKKATLQAGYAFFDLYEAMGGSGSIIKWVEGHPKKAMSDYTHFNKRGGKIVADWLYDAIMKDYSEWHKQDCHKVKD